MVESLKGAARSSWNLV